MWVKILEKVYGIVKSYMLAQAKDTGNASFSAQLNQAFSVVEKIWPQIKQVVADNKKKKKQPKTPPTLPPQVNK